MSLKVLIVDDDLVMRTSLKTMLDWENHGFAICSEAVNGSNAIQIIEANPPDIVITDMRMPVMDGVALIEYLEKNYPQMQTIALSGYDDFDYVRQSMKKGAVDYILKHKLNRELLLDVLNTARENINEVKKAMNERSSTIEKLANAKDILGNEFVKKLITSELTDIDIIRNNISYLNLAMDMKNLVIAAVEIDDYSFIEDRYPVIERNKLLKTFADISRSILNESGKALIEHIDHCNYVIIFSFGNTYSVMNINNRVLTDINRIKTSLKRYLNITASFGISQVCQTIHDIGRGYLEAKEHLEDKFFKGKDRIFSKNTVEKNHAGNITLNINDENKILVLIKSLDKHGLHLFIESFFDNILKSNMSYQSVQIITAELINIASRTAREYGIDISVFFSEKGIPYNTLQKYDTIADIKEWILNIYDKLTEYLKEKNKNSGYSEITKKAVGFIGSNYSKNISLNEASQFAGVSSSYLSHVFKEDTGKGFVEYLNSFRIEKAKNLIANNNTSIKDVIRELGFNNYNYFFKVFKEYTGKTPLEYVESMKKIQC